MSRRQTVCGALTGGVAACGLVLGRRGNHGHAERAALRADTYDRAGELIRRFEERFGCLDCRTMVGCDFSSPEGRKQWEADGGRQKVCEPAVRMAIETVVELCGSADR